VLKKRARLVDDRKNLEQRVIAGNTQKLHALTEEKNRSRQSRESHFSRFVAPGLPENKRGAATSLAATCCLGVGRDGGKEGEGVKLSICRGKGRQRRGHAPETAQRLVENRQRTVLCGEGKEEKRREKERRI